MDTQAGLTISRADLIEITTQALAASEGVTDEQKLEMCETAHKTKSVLAGSWLTKDCGCLVGATYRERLPGEPHHVGGMLVQEKLGAPMMNLGCKFDQGLKAKTACGYGPITVID